jgi:hypothetical protein
MVQDKRRMTVTGIIEKLDICFGHAYAVLQDDPKNVYSKCTVMLTKGAAFYNDNS